jgi:hypothetical protein
MKTCITCKKEKDISEFPKDSSKKDGLRPECKPCKSIGDRKWREKNKEIKKKKDKEYYEANAEMIKERTRKWCSNPTRKERRKVLDYANRENRNKLDKERRNNDISYNLKCLISGRIRTALKSKKEFRSIEYLGCTILEFKNWIEYQFDKNMNWENQGIYWHLDHVKPCASFNFNNKEEINECFNWQNVRPCEKFENISKGDKIMPELINDHKKLVKKYKVKLEKERTKDLL